jgi:hypothetical protein
MRIDRWKLFLDLEGGGAWPFLVGGVICLVNSVNERDLVVVVGRPKPCFACLCPTPTLGGEPRDDRGNNRSVMPFDVLGRTRATLLRAPGTFTPGSTDSGDREDGA